MNGWLKLVLGCGVVVLLTACRAGSVVPSGWSAVSGPDAGPVAVAAEGAAEAWVGAEAGGEAGVSPGVSAGAGSGKVPGKVPGEVPGEIPGAGGASLQVYIHYRFTHSSHTAVRVGVGDGSALAVFWDPGGAYGLTRPSYGRHHDVIVDKPPDAQTWWAYRAKWLREPLLLVFEWDLEVAHAKRLREALLDGARHGRSATRFKTVRLPGLCNLGVTEFLQEFGPPVIEGKLARYVMPDGLAQELWKQRPDRVLRFEGAIDARPTVWVPGEDVSPPATELVDTAGGPGGHREGG
ncbi:MAG: hypothetical protein AAGG38_09735 [Planctomycetota bacterium]